MTEKMTVRAPRNPYRQESDGMVALGDFGWSVAPTRGPRRIGDEGPGLLAADLDHIVRQHYRDGYAAAEHEADRRLDEMRGRLAEVFDEGYTAGRGEQVQEFARELYSRLMSVGFALAAAENAPKSRLAERLPATRAALDRVTGFLLSYLGDEGRDRATAQAVRDETR